VQAASGIEGVSASAAPFDETANAPSLFIPTQPQELFGEAAESEADPSNPERNEYFTPPSPDSAGPSAAYSPGDEIQSLRQADEEKQGPSFRRLSASRYSNYRSDESGWSWLPGSGQDFGWLSLEGTTFQPRGRHTGLGGNFGLHLLGGPVTVPVPPRLYDFALGFQTRDSLSDQFSYDLATSVGVYSDFEGSARDGVRFPSHAVGMFHINGSTDFVFGIDYLDRDDIALLPVIGVSLRDQYVPGLRFDLVFPRPRIEYVLSDTSRVYVSGVLGGGTWEIEFPDGTDQVMSYRDFRLALGFEVSDRDGGTNALEFGYVFGRALEFRGDPVTTHFDDAFLLRWVWRH
jgi:hypothetical protein